MTYRKPVTENRFVFADTVPWHRRDQNPDLVEDRWMRLCEDAGVHLAEILDERMWAVSFHRCRWGEPDLEIERLELTVFCALLDWRQAEVGEWVHDIREAMELPGRNIIRLLARAPATDAAIADIWSEVPYEKRTFERIGRYWVRRD